LESFQSALSVDFRGCSTICSKPVQCREALDLNQALIINRSIDHGYLDTCAFKRLCKSLPSWFQFFAVATPWSHVHHDHIFARVVHNCVVVTSYYGQDGVKFILFRDGFSFYYCLPFGERFFELIRVLWEPVHNLV
jgi:hypothetical protein